MAEGTSACPTCGVDFKHEMAMKVHHKKQHGESIAGVLIECDYCGAEFRNRRPDVENYDHNFCSDECEKSWRSENMEGDKHFNYKRITVECETCGAEIERNPARLEKQDHQFCDQQCYGEWVSKNQPPKRGKSVDVVCEWCGNEFSKQQAKAEKVDLHFCDRDCYMEWHKRNMRGENNPRWNGGTERYYGPNWHEQRRKARERDDHTCQLCGSEDTLGKNMHVHHKTPISEFKSNGELDYESANDLENIITLCHNCHMRVEKHAPLMPPGIE